MRSSATASRHRLTPPSHATVSRADRLRAQVGEDRLREEWNSERLPGGDDLGLEVDVGSSRLWKKRAGGLARHSPMLHGSNSSSKAASRSPSRSTTNCNTANDLLAPPALSKPAFRRSGSGGSYGSGSEASGPSVDAHTAQGPSSSRPQSASGTQEEQQRDSDGR